VALVKAAALEAGAVSAVEATHWTHGGAGAVELARAVESACIQSRGSATFQYLYPLSMPLKGKIETVCREVYGAGSVTFSAAAESALAGFAAAGYGAFPVCCAKTHLSLSTDASAKGVPSGFAVHVRDVKASVGAGFVTPLLGDIMTIPGLPIRPGYYDVELTKGKVEGLF
jgi:formyltetrahydrofolate synthetase